MKRIVFALLLLFLFINTINALEECTPSEEYKKYMSLTEEEKKNYIQPPYCSDMIQKNDDNNNFLVSFFNSFTNTVEASFLDSSYNAVTAGLITTPQNQGQLGTCWAFSSMSVVEANARKNNIADYDFSERHMIYSVLSSGYNNDSDKKGKYYTTGFNGGKVTYAASYFFNNYGQLLENKWPYTDQLPQISHEDYKNGNKIISVGGFDYVKFGSNGSCNNGTNGTVDEISYIKKQIIKYGSVQSSVFIHDNFFKDNKKTYYYVKSTDIDPNTGKTVSLPNHGISIVGWDDNISGSNFGTSRKGAFIIKNSWGDNWGNKRIFASSSSDRDYGGYFYISYDDIFICKNIASFYDVSNKTFENTYASADMIGDFSIGFNGTLYTSAKFTKSNNSELLQRVSFPVGKDLNYYVYLVSDNNLSSTTNWQLLTSGSSDTYGIKSVDLNGYTLTNTSFTIVVKYVADTSNTTSFFTMCTNVDDTSKMEISSGKNYIGSTLNNWTDMKSISLQNTTLSCEPNIYVYTNNITSGSITINSITPYSNSSSNNKFTVSFTNNSVSTNSISYKITNSSGSVVTSNFTISPNYSTNKVIVESNGKVSGTFNFIIKYGTTEVKRTFNITENISINNSSLLNISGTNIYVNISNKEKFTYSKLINGLNIYNSNVQVLDKNGKTITTSSSVIGTNAKLKTNNQTYLVVVLGDINCDGGVSALDYIEVRKHIMGSKITDTGKLKASDLDKNGNINALDYIAVRMILMR